MKCLIVTTLERQITLFLLPHIKLLQSMGYEITIATSYSSKSEIKSILPNVHLHALPLSRNIKSLSNIKAFFIIKKLMKREKYDLVHVHSPIASFITRIAAPKRQKVIYTAHGFHFNENGSPISNRIFYTAEKIAAKKTERLIVINKDDYQKATEFLPKDKIHYIHGIGVDTTHFNRQKFIMEQQKVKKELNIKDNTVVITHIAEFNENKRQIDIIIAAEKLKAAHQDFIILLLGDGELLETIKEEVVTRDLENFVHCLGFQKDITRFLSITDIGLLISLREGLPKSIMEMMAMNIPVIATDIRGNRELVVPGENGYLIPIKSPDELTEALGNLLQNKSLRIKMGMDGRKKILEKYDLSIILAEMRRIYESVNPISHQMKV